MERKKKLFKQKNSIVKRVLNFMLALVMVLTMMQGLPGVVLTARAESFEKSKITVHFQNNDNWTNVYAKIAEGSDWNPIDGYAYANSWPGAKIEQDTANNGWYSFTITVDASTELKLIYNNNNKVNTSQTSNIEFSADAENIEKWYEYGTGEISKPEGWNTSTNKAPTNASAVTSPEVNGRSVTFRYQNVGAKQVRLAGAMTDWAEGAVDMVKGEDNVWSVTVPLTPGAYQYKFIVDEKYPKIDPANPRASSGNSLVVVPGLMDASFQVEKGVTKALPALSFYNETTSEVKPTSYEVVTDEAKPYVTISDGKVTVGSDFSGETFEIKATYSVYTATITVTVVEKKDDSNIEVSGDDNQDSSDSDAQNAAGSATVDNQDSSDSDAQNAAGSAAVVYQILDGALSSWTPDSSEGLTIRGAGDLDKFTGVKVDGILLDRSNYTAEAGSTIITFSAPYLSTLTSGIHTVEMLWTDGSASTMVTINANSLGNKDAVPKTGDSNPIVWLLILACLSGAGLLLTGKKGKKNI